MRTDLMISIIVCIGSAVLVKFLSFKLIPDNISSFKKVFAGIFSWIFFLGTVAWMILFGDTLAEWLISPEDGLSLSILISSVVFLSVYFLEILLMRLLLFFALLYKSLFLFLSAWSLFLFSQASLQ